MVLIDRKPLLVFKRLTPEEEKLAVGLAASINPEDPGESWGTHPDGRPNAAKQVWGVFQDEALISAMWLNASPGGVARITCMAVPRRRHHAGLLAFMMSELAPKFAKAGGKAIVATIERGGDALGDSLADAGFIGPELDDDNYPAGEWRRDLGD